MRAAVQQQAHAASRWEVIHVINADLAAWLWGRSGEEGQQDENPIKG